MEKNPQDRMAERILAMGYTEAKRRRNMVAKLDALMDATAAFCDVYVETREFFLPNVDLLYERESVSRTIAEFDVWTRNVMPQRPTTGLSNGWSLNLPASIKQEQIADLIGWWTCCIKELNLNAQRPPAPTFSAHDPNATNEFHRSLRYAFDALPVRPGTTERLYTLRVDYGGHEYRLSEDGRYRDTRAMGYCFSASQARKLNLVAPAKDERPEEVASHLAKIDAGWDSRFECLEEIQRPPADGGPFLTQSQNNMATRIATLVRNSGLRSEKLTRSAVLWGSRNGKEWLLERAAWQTLERRAFDRSERPLLYLMPLTNHEIIGSDVLPETLALWFLAVDSDLDVETLLERRFAACAAFSQVLYDRYCKAIGKEVATEIVHRSSSLPGRLASLATAFRLAAVSANKSEGATLSDELDRLNLAMGDKPSQWAEATRAGLRETRIHVPDVRPTMLTDVLQRVRRSLDVEEGTQALIKESSEETRRLRERQANAVAAAKRFVQHEHTLKSMVSSVVTVRESLDPLAPATELFDECVAIAKPIFADENCHEVRQVCANETRFVSEVAKARKKLADLRARNRLHRHASLLEALDSRLGGSFVDAVRHLKALDHNSLCVSVFCNCDHAGCMKSMRPLNGGPNRHLTHGLLWLWEKRRDWEVTVNTYGGVARFVGRVDNVTAVAARARELVDGNWPADSLCTTSTPVAAIARGLWGDAPRDLAYLTWFGTSAIEFAFDAYLEP